MRHDQPDSCEPWSALSRVDSDTLAVRCRRRLCWDAIGETRASLPSQLFGKLFCYFYVAQLASQSVATTLSMNTDHFVKELFEFESMTWSLRSTVFGLVSLDRILE